MEATLMNTYPWENESITEDEAWERVLLGLKGTITLSGSIDNVIIDNRDNTTTYKTDVPYTLTVS